MKFIAVFTGLFIAAGYYAEEKFLAGPNPSMSNHDAVTACSEKGGILLSYTHIEANPSAPEYLSQLRNGESAWIGGYAKLSPFLTWQGCYNTTNLLSDANIHGRTNQDRSVYSCWKLCNQPSSEQMYIGIKDMVCYCVKQSQRYHLQKLVVNDVFCSIPCSENVIESCGGLSSMSLYGIIEEARIPWAEKEPSPRLCAYVKRNSNYPNKFRTYTASCYSIQSIQINGYICTNSAWSRLSMTNCITSDTSLGTYCIIEDYTTRMGAHKGCLSNNGSLADLGAEQTIPRLMKQNFNYWIGIFRTFYASEIFIPNETVCLSVTKGDESFYLEPDDCSAQKYYLCSSTSVNPDRTLITRFHSGESLTTTRKSSDIYSDINEESPVPYIIPSVLIVVFSLLVIVFVSYRRYIKRIQQRTQISQDHYNAIYEADNMKNEQSFSSDPDPNADSKCLIAKAKPQKPERRTVIRRHRGSEYENYFLTNDEKEKQKKQTKTRFEDAHLYDKISFNPNAHNVKDVYEINNVYDHMSETGNGCYDTMKSKMSAKSLDRVDDSYSHIEKGSIINDCCVSVNATEKLSNKVNMDKTVSNLTPQQTDVVIEDEKPRRFIMIDDNSIDSEGDKINETDSQEQDVSVNYSVITSLQSTSHREDITGYYEVNDNDDISYSGKKETKKAESDKSDINSTNDRLDNLNATNDKQAKIKEENKLQLNYVEVDLSETEHVEHD